MMRHISLAVLVVLAVAVSAQAGVVISSVESPSALAGHSLWTLTATSDNAAEPILGFDFAGDPANDDPATGLGFFGAMGQVNPFGASSVYQDSNPFISGTGRNVNEDSQFLFLTTNPIVVASAAASQESANLLQATFAFADPQGLSLAFAQLVIPTATGTVAFRGDVLVGQSGAGVNARVGGTVGGGIVPVLPVVNDLGPLVNDINNNPGTVSGTVTGTDVATWAATLTNPTYTPGFGAVNPVGLLNQPTWDPLTQLFTWNTNGSTRGTYTWDIVGSNPDGSDTGLITVEQRFVPEPSTFALFGLAMVGAFGLGRKRS